MAGDWDVDGEELQWIPLGFPLQKNNLTKIKESGAWCAAELVNEELVVASESHNLSPAVAGNLSEWLAKTKLLKDTGSKG